MERSQHKTKLSQKLHETADRKLDEVVAVDDVSGMELDIEKLREARRAEIAYFKKMNVYEKVPISKCLQETGKAPISVRWIDVNKQE